MYTNILKEKMIFLCNRIEIVLSISYIELLYREKSVMFCFFFYTYKIYHSDMISYFILHTFTQRIERSIFAKIITVY